MDDNMAAIGARLRELRDHRGATQAEVAAIIDASDETVVSKIENGKRGLGSYELARLCEFFGVSSDTILFGSNSGASAGALLRADSGDDAARVVSRVEEAFADLRYVRSLVES